MAVTQPAADLQAPRYDVLELVVKVAALIAVVLPIVGAGVRAIAFLLAGVPNPLDMAATQPVSGLFITALKANWPSVLPVVILSVLTYQNWSRPHLASTDTPPTWRRWAILGLGVLFLAPAAFALAWPGGLVGVLVWTVISYRLGWWTARRELTFYRIAFVVLVGGVATAVGAGINGLAVGDQVNNYTFVSSAALADGEYALVGESDGFVYLESCHRHGIVGIRQQDIMEFSEAKPTNVQSWTNLFQIMFRGASPKFGYRPGC